VQRSCTAEDRTRDDRLWKPLVTARQGQTLTLTLAADPELSRLTGLVTTHFLRQNGLTAAAARRGAGAVERRCRSLLLAARRSGRRDTALVLTLRPGSSTLEVFGRAAGGTETCLIRVTRPGPAPGGDAPPA
jgi:hypothetical protein